MSKIVFGRVRLICPGSPEGDSGRPTSRRDHEREILKARQENPVGPRVKIYNYMSATSISGGRLHNYLEKILKQLKSISDELIILNRYHAEQAARAKNNNPSKESS